MGLHHRKITPFWKTANGEVGRFIKKLEKCVRAATVERKNWKQELYKFLRQYRATPHSTSDISPCETLNRRKLKTTLLEVTPPVLEKQKKMTDRDAEQTMKMKAYADQKLGVRESKIKLGDTVLVAIKVQQAKPPVQSNTSRGKRKKPIYGYGKRWEQNCYAELPSHLRHNEKITQEQADEDLTAEPWSPKVSELDKSPSSPSPTAAQRGSQKQTRLPAKLKDFVLLVR